MYKNKNLKKKICCVIMALILSVSSILPVQAEIHYYEKYKGFKYRFFEENSLCIEYYQGKKSKVKVPAKINGTKVRFLFLKKAKNVKEIRIPRYVKYVELGGIKTLKKVKVSKKNKYLSVTDNIVLNKKKTKMVGVLGGYSKITVPKTVKTIKGGAFYSSRVKKVIITENVKNIKNGSFDNVDRLKTIVFKGNTIPKIEYTAFSTSNTIKFYVNSKELAKELLKELEGKMWMRVHIYVGDKLIYNKKISRDDCWLFFRDNVKVLKSLL